MARSIKKFKLFFLIMFLLTSMYYFVSYEKSSGVYFPESINLDLILTASSKQKQRNEVLTTSEDFTQVTNTVLLEFENKSKMSLLEIFKEAALLKFLSLMSVNASTTNQLTFDERKHVALRNRKIANAREMQNYNFGQTNVTSLSELLMNKNGKPIRNVIFTTWRSGSTFLGEVITSHPATFYHYEPLLHFDIVQVRSGELAIEGIRVLESLLRCNYSNLDNYVKYGKGHHWLLSHNWRLWRNCEHDNMDLCLDEKFLSEMCRLFPFQIMKTVRMRLKLTEKLLKDDSLDLRVLYLVRDPRGTLQSRKHREWCPPNPDCSDPKHLCSDLVEDFHAAVTLREKYPTKIMLARYEDISLNPLSGVKKIFKFFRLDYNLNVERFIKLHTVKTRGGVSSTFRDSKITPFKWIKSFQNNNSSDELIKIQSDCTEAMKLWGYVPLTKANLNILSHPLLKPPWQDMIIPNDT